jgi:hypothetical protein
MATTVNQTYPHMTNHSQAHPEFTDLARDCDEFALMLIDNKNAAERRVICQFLQTSLEKLRPTLNDPIPPHLMDAFTVETLPERVPCFEPDTDQLCDYCLALSELLNEEALPSAMEKALRGLLCELVWFFAEELNAPRWLKTADGIKAIVN